MSVVQTSGSQTATLGTEHTLATVTDAGNFWLVVDAANLANDETLELRIYGKARSSDTERLMYVAGFTHAQTAPLKISDKVPSPHHMKVTLKQTGGTGRAFPWAVYKERADVGAALGTAVTTTVAGKLDVNTSNFGTVQVGQSNANKFLTWTGFFIVDTITGGTATTVVLTTALGNDNEHVGWTLLKQTVSGSKYEARRVTAYDEATKTITVDAAFTFTPASSDVVVLVPGAPINDLSAAEVNAEVDTALTDYDGPTHAELISEINDVQSDIAGLNNLSAAEVNAEVDTALNTAIPGSPTANSINERVKAIDDKLPAGTLSDFDEAADTVTVGTNNDKTGYRLSAAGVDDVMDEVYEGTTTFRQFLRLAASALFGKLAGAATTNVTIRDEADTKNRIDATVDADGNRTAVTLDKT